MTTLLPTGTDPRKLAESLATQGLSAAVIPGTADRRGTFDAFAATLNFPDYFGRNLDALLDCLRDLSDNTALIWDDAGRLRQGDPAGYRGILAVLTQFERERPTAGVFVIR